MNLQEYRQLQAEIGALKLLLAGLPADRVVERLGLESRMQEVEMALAAHPEPIREPLRTRLTFRGKPIVGSHGIFADFGALVVAAFSETVAAIGASLTGPLGARGVLPCRDDFRLVITGTAPGSFGFQFEEAPPDSPTWFPEECPLEPAISQAKAIMRATLGTDDELTEALSESDPRAIDAIRRFLDTMAKHEAVCTMEFKEDVFRFADVEQVRRSVDRLKQDNIHEDDVDFEGQFQGVLPHRRTFEFLEAKSKEVIVGKVSMDIVDPALINSILLDIVHVSLHRRRVGVGRPRYTLIKYVASGGKAETDAKSE